MSSINQHICYMIDSTLLDRYVDIDDQKEDKVSQKHIRPWFTMCVEPISHMLLASALSLDPPGPAVIKSLLYQALLPSKNYPYGRRPDILWLAHSSLFIVPQQQRLFQRLQIVLERTPFLNLAVSERMFHSLALFLSAYSSHSLSFFQVETIRTQWMHVCPQSLHDQPKQDFLEYCQTRWQTSPVNLRELDLLFSLDL